MKNLAVLFLFVFTQVAFAQRMMRAKRISTSKKMQQSMATTR